MTLTPGIKNLIKQFSLLNIKYDKIKISKQNYKEFNDTGIVVKADEINYNNYKIGDKIITIPAAKWGYRERLDYLRSWCIDCNHPNKKQTLNNDYFENKFDTYSCEGCRHNKQHPCGGGALMKSDKSKICHNCYERFIYKNKYADEYCNDCYDII